jgi:hypothetical protein
VLQEQLGGAAGRPLGPGGTGGEPVFVQSPRRRQRLVERGAPPAGALVAVPATVGPLPGDQRPGQQLDPRVGGQPEAAAVHEHDPVGQLHRLFLVVGDEDAGRMHLVVHAPEPGAQLGGHARVQRPERLVQQQHSGPHARRLAPDRMRESVYGGDVAFNYVN